MTEPSTSTTTGLGRGTSRTTVAIKRISLAAIALLAALDLAGLTGVHTSTATDDRDGWRLAVSYPALARPGLDTTWHVRVEHPGGFGDHLTLALDADWFAIFETQGFFPEPDSEHRDVDTLYLEFDDPPGDVFELDYDAYIQPASQRGRSGGARLLDASGSQVAAVTWRTRLWP